MSDTGLTRDFFRSFWLVFSKRMPVFALMNLAFFGSVLVAAFLAQSWVPSPGVSIEAPVVLSIFGDGLSMLLLSIFLFNLVVSAFLLLTLTGTVFFAFPVAVLVWRGWLWGSLLSQLSMSSFLWVLPTLVLEGEGYVVASATGIVLGLSWLKPTQVFGGEQLSRVGSFKKAWMEAARFYVTVALLLFVAASLEAFTLTLLT